MIRLGFGVTVLANAMHNGGIDGIGSYTRELLKRYAVAPDVDLLPYSYGQRLPSIDHVARGTLQLRGFAMVSVASAVSGLPFPSTACLRRELDLVHATDHMIPYFGKLPVVATLMDAIPFSHPQWVRQNQRWIKNTLWRHAANRAQQIVTISEYSKRQITQHFRVPESKISVVPLGVDERWFAPLAAGHTQTVLNQHALPEQYLLCVGTLQPRKNIARVIEAYRSLPDGVRNHAPLVIVGRAGWNCEDVVNGLTSGAFGPTVIWLKHLPDRDLLAVVKGATALVFASLNEGFGLPVLEAFAAGTPVIASNTTSVPEVAGDAALAVDPADTHAIAAAMQRMLDEPALRDSLRVKGGQRAREHSWDRTAAMTFDIYRRVLGR